MKSEPFRTASAPVFNERSVSQITADIRKLDEQVEQLAAKRTSLVCELTDLRDKADVAIKAATVS